MAKTLSNRGLDATYGIPTGQIGYGISNRGLNNTYSIPQNGTGFWKDLGSGIKKVAKQTHIVSTLGNVLKPTLVAGATAFGGPEAGILANSALDKGTKYAAKKGYGKKGKSKK